MRDKIQESEHFTNNETVYGPVKSWRLGQSLGIDPIFQTSTCSFNCIYCQLGSIQKITNELKVYVSTQKVVQDFQKIVSKKTPIDVMTYSGSGEPTLALNLGEMIDELRKLRPDIKQIILTNATELYRQEVRENVKKLDRVIVKIDASNQKMFELINRPVSGATLERSIQGILKLKKEFSGKIEIQSMFMPMNKNEFDDYVLLIKKISPDLIQLNTPKRPYPLEWHRENRGNHKLLFDYETKKLKILDSEEIKNMAETLEQQTGIKVISS